MAWSDLLYSWLVGSALASLAVLIVGSGAAALCREPARRLRIIELAFLGCLVVPWLGMAPGYPRLALGAWSSAPLHRSKIAAPPSVEQPAVGPLLQLSPVNYSIADATVEEAEPVVSTWDVKAWMAAMYGVGVALGLVWWLVGMARLAGILRTARPASPRCGQLLAEIAGSSANRVRLLISSRTNQPFACVWRHAIIVLPESLCDDERAVRWSLAHEWTHIEHHHFRIWIAACMARVLFFYQPLAWWLRGQLRLCQDYLADARAGREVAQPEDYAEFLTRRSMIRSLCPTAGGLGMGLRKSELYKRVVMLVQRPPIESRVPRLWNVSAICAAVACVALVAALAADPRADASDGSCAADDETSTAQDSPQSVPGAVQREPRVLTGGSDATEKTIVTSLRWLANHQLADGSWSFNHGLCPTCRGQCRNPGSLATSRNAATGLALLPFLGSGQTHLAGKYKNTIRRGLFYLVEHMRRGLQGGALNESGGNMYAHGLASIALCEAYAMTRDEELSAPAQFALDFTSFAQDPKGGGWRYKPQEKGDTSVFGCQLAALKSGQLSGLRVPALTMQRASLFLDSVQSDDGSAYGYTAPKSGSEATEAIGLLCRMHLGWKKDNPALQQGVKFLDRHGPSDANMYFNYYATQVMCRWQGEAWSKWDRKLRDQLIHSQSKQGHEDGSWFTGPGDNGAGPGGRLYCTALATMILEVPYRHLPIYRAQAADNQTASN